MNTTRTKGYFGPCKGSPLTESEVAALANGSRVEVVWIGGNGPHTYIVQDDLSERERHLRGSLVSRHLLLRSADFVALAK